MKHSSGEKEPLLHKRNAKPRESHSIRFSTKVVSVGDDGDVDVADDGDEDLTPSTRRSLFRSSSSLSNVFQALSKSERQEALKKEGVGGAAFLIRDAVLGDANASAGSYDPYANPESVLRNLFSIICRRLINFRPLVRMQLAAVSMMVILTFIEPPVWCQRWDQNDEGGCVHLLTMTGIALGEDESSDPVLFYPNTKSMLLTTHQSMIVEYACLLVVLFFSLLRFGRDGMSFSHFFRRGEIRSIRAIRLFCVLGLTVGLVTKYRTYQPYLRGILLCSFMPSVMRYLGLMVHMLPEIMNVLALLAVFITFYAWFGCVMFVDTAEGDNHFSNIFEAWWTLWICVTTANYPDVMMLSYNQNRWTAVYFISFMLVSFFFLMNVILSSVVGEYESALENRQKELSSLAEKNLEDAFRLMDPKRTGRIDRETVMALFYILNEDFPEVRTLSDDDTKLLFAILDKDGSSTITEDEFMDFGNVLLLEFIRTDVYKTAVEIYFPKVYASRWYKRFEKSVKSDQFELLIDIILVVNAIVVGIQSYPELSSTRVHIDPQLYDGSIDTVWELMETVFTVIYVLEAILKIIVLSWRRYIEIQRNVFDLSVTILAVVSSIIVYYPNEFSDSRLIRMVVMIRVLRLVRLLGAIKRFQLIATISAEILPDAAPIVSILFLIMYFFAAVGVHLYGGYITRDPSDPKASLVLGTDFSDNNYWANNFNDMIGAMNVLFNLLVINNWTECEIGFEATTQSKWVRFYFLAFHLVGVILVNNVVSAFIINSFMTQLAIMRERNEAEIIDGEAVLYHEHAVFDGAVVTGTQTNLKGDFIARIRHTAQSEEGHYHERLKRLFSRSSSTGEDKSFGVDETRAI